jgi:hypothetical protein
MTKIFDWRGLSKRRPSGRQRNNRGLLVVAAQADCGIYDRRHRLHAQNVMENSLSIFQCLIRRTEEAVDGMRTAWNASNLLTAITMGRSLIETGATVRHFIDSVKEATRQRDVVALDRVVMNVGFGTRYEPFKGEDQDYKAKNILTLIEAVDKSLFKDKTPRLREAYDRLSEFAHPNHLGLLGLYSATFSGEYQVQYGNKQKKKEMILPEFRITLGMIWLVDIAAADLEALVPQIAAFVPK